jgi:hypothetical protein
MRKTLLTSAALLGMAMALPAFAQTATDPNPANPSAVKDGTPAAGTGSGAAPGNDPATAGKTGATLGNQAPSQGPGPMGETANPGPSSGQSSESSMGAPSTTTTSDQTPAKPRHHSMSSSTTSGNDHWAHQPGTGESGPASSQASNIDGADTHSTIAPHLPSPGVGENASPDRYLKVADQALRAHKSGEAQQALEMAETRLLDRSTAPAAANAPDQAPRVQAVSTALRDLAAKDWNGARRSIQEAMNAGGQGGAGAEGGAMGGGVGSGGDAGQTPGGVANTSTTTNVTVQGQGSGYNVSTGHPGANPAPLAGTVNSPGTMGAAGVNNPGAPTAPNPSNPGNEAKPGWDVPSPPDPPSMMRCTPNGRRGVWGGAARPTQPCLPPLLLNLWRSARCFPISAPINP